MSEYKRLTKKNIKYLDRETTCPEIARLQELEDKLEQGKMIELPCKVGDTIWYVSYIRIEKDRAINILEEWDVEKIDIYEDLIICRLTHKGTDHYNTARNDEFGKSWFLTKAEAEKRLKELKELQNGNNT